MENYTGNVTVSKLGLGSPPSPRVKGFHRRGFFCLFSGSYPRHHQEQSTGSRVCFRAACLLRKNITGILSSFFNLSEVPV